MKTYRGDGDWEDVWKLQREVETAEKGQITGWEVQGTKMAEGDWNRDRHHDVSSMRDPYGDGDDGNGCVGNQ